jgi:hypothetical protein
MKNVVKTYEKRFISKALSITIIKVLENINNSLI